MTMADRRGHLVLVVGPSGAGKDTLIAEARRACCAGEVHFPRRVVTREASAFEDNQTVTPAEFEAARARGDFALAWQAHGLSYALTREIDADLAAGRTVVANVSRQVVAQARQRYGDTADVTVVLVTAPVEVLAERLAQRHRASDGPLAERLERHVTITPDVTITNVGPVAARGAELLAVLRRGRPVAAEKPQP
jgi:ribose 1,5-bisphosphokinase